MARAAAQHEPPRVSVVVVTYEAGPTLARCLAALRRQSLTDLEIILVDNASTDGAAQAAAAADPSLRRSTRAPGPRAAPGWR
jgi:N-acetylglucosaminyl-diphospho-decaprenol L-rhamnosyltransferase